jgi:peptidoglycan/LPS O-acetylase OafA/YrhL
VKEQDWSIKKKSLAKRLGGLITGYYFVAFISSTGNIESIQDILKILFLIEIPGYTEFLLPFILFGTIILSGRNPIRKIVRTFPSTLIFSIFFFVLGNTVFDLNISGGMQPYISIIAGSDSLYRFPLLQYSPVFLLGLYFGKLINRKGHSIRTISIPYILTLLILVSTHFITPKIYHLNTFDRWPPSIAFLSAGLLVSFFMIYFSSYFEEYNSIKPLVKLGKTALGIYIWHDIILQINAKVFKFETDSHFLILTAFGTILLVSFGIVTLYRHIRYK